MFSCGPRSVSPACIICSGVVWHTWNSLDEMLITILLLLAPILFIPILTIVGCRHGEVLLLALAFIDVTWCWRMIMAVIDRSDIRSDIFIVCGQ